MGPAPSPGRTASAAVARKTRAGRRPSNAPRWRRSRASVAKAEAQIEVLSRQIATIEAALADPDLYRRDSDRAQALARERGKLIAARAEAEPTGSPPARPTRPP